MSPALQPASFFSKTGTRADANNHKTFACRYIPNNICTVVEEWTSGYFCLGYISSTHFDIVLWLAQKVWRQCVLVFARDLGFRGGNCNGLLANTGLFLSTDNRYLFPPSTPDNPFRLFVTAPDSLSPCLASKFRNQSF